MRRAAGVSFVALACACAAREEPANPPPPAAVPPTPSDATPAAGPLDSATVAPVDLTSIPAFAEIVMNAPPGARVIPDEPDGVTISSGEFALHLWFRGGIGGEADRMPARVDGQRTYVELLRRSDRLEYRIDEHGWNADGSLRTTPSAYGFVVPVPNLGGPGSKLLCGPAKLPASAEGLRPYRAACDSVTARGQARPAPSSFASVDLRGIARFADVAVMAPAGAVVVADAPRGATIASTGFALHLQCERIGDLLAARKARATRDGATYAEVASDAQFASDYTIDAGGTRTYGFVETIVRDSLSFTRACDSDGLLCGPQDEQATAAALVPYRAACASVMKRATPP